MERMRDKKWRDVECPFCWVLAEIKAPMVFDYNTGVWQCTRGNHTAANLEDDNEEAVRNDLRMMFVESQKDRDARYQATSYSLAMVGAIKRGGGSSSGRRRKKPRKRIMEKPGTLA